MLFKKLIVSADGTEEQLIYESRDNAARSNPKP